MHLLFPTYWASRWTFNKVQFFKKCMAKTVFLYQHKSFQWKFNFAYTSFRCIMQEKYWIILKVYKFCFQFLNHTLSCLNGSLSFREYCLGNRFYSATLRTIILKMTLITKTWNRMHPYIAITKWTVSGPRTLHDLSCQFGTKGFSKEMRQIAGGSQSGLRKFLQQAQTMISQNNQIFQEIQFTLIAQWPWIVQILIKKQFVFLLIAVSFLFY